MSDDNKPKYEMFLDECYFYSSIQNIGLAKKLQFHKKRFEKMYEDANKMGWL